MNSLYAAIDESSKTNVSYYLIRQDGSKSSSFSVHVCSSSLPEASGQKSMGICDIIVAFV